MCVCVCVCVCVKYVCVYAYMYACMHVYRYACMYGRAYIDVKTRILEFLLIIFVLISTSSKR